MKNYLLLFVFGISFSCSTEDLTYSEADLIGKWNLIAILSDPGDGSGTFQKVKSDKTIEFKNDGIVMTNGSLCDPYSLEVRNSGSFSLDNKTIITNCQNPNIEMIYFEIDTQHLILNFISNEGYSQKFKKIEINSRK